MWNNTHVTAFMRTKLLQSISHRFYLNYHTINFAESVSFGPKFLLETQNHIVLPLSDNDSYNTSTRKYSVSRHELVWSKKLLKEVTLHITDSAHHEHTSVWCPAFHNSVHFYQHSSLLPTSVIQVRRYSNSTNTPEISRVQINSLGTDIDVGYLDAGPKDGKTAVAIHGALGGHTDFDALIKPLTENGLRLLIPNFPGNGLTHVTDPTKYDHGTRARVEFIRQFLINLEIENVDVLILFSAGGFSGFTMVENINKFRSIVALSCASHRPSRAIRPLWYLRLLYSALGIPSLRPRIMKTIVKGFEKAGLPVDNTEHMLASLGTIANADLQGTELSGTWIKGNGIPVLSAMSLTDEIVEFGIGVSFALIMGIPYANFCVLDKDSKPTGEMKDAGDPFRRVLLFQRGGHYIHREHTEVIVQQILQLIKSLKK